MINLKHLRRPLRRSGPQETNVCANTKVVIAEEVTNEGCEVSLIQESEMREDHDSHIQLSQARNSVDGYESTGSILIRLDDAAISKHSPVNSDATTTSEDAAIIDITSQNAIIVQHEDAARSITQEEEKAARPTDLTNYSPMISNRENPDQPAIHKYTDKIEMMKRKHEEDSNYLFRLDSSDSLETISVASHVSDSESAIIYIDGIIAEEEEREERALRTAETFKTVDTGVTKFEKAVSGYMDCFFLVCL
jgi:hypothetical protein